MTRQPDCRETLHQDAVDDELVPVRLDLELSLLALHVDLALLGPDEGPFVDIRMDLKFGIVAELQHIVFVDGSLLSITHVGCWLCAVIAIIGSKRPDKGLHVLESLGAER
jgi:hypothetical protein